MPEGYPILDFITNTIGEFNFGLLMAIIIMIGWVTDRIWHQDDL